MVPAPIYVFLSAPRRSASKQALLFRLELVGLRFLRLQHVAEEGFCLMVVTVASLHHQKKAFSKNCSTGQFC